MLECEIMRKIFLFFILSFVINLTAAEYDPPLLSFAAGKFDITRKHPKWLGQLEWKPNYLVYGLRPFVSFFFTEKNSTYFAAGLGYDFFLSKRFVITPSFGPGIYFKGQGKDLHYPLEFRSSIEAALRFPNYSRFGVQFYHISNASLGKKNPGSEILTIFYSFPLQR